MSAWGGRRVMTLRAQWQARIDAGGIRCPRCGLDIVHGQRWDIGHAVSRALGGRDSDGLHPEHASCNRRAGGQLAAQLAGRRVAGKSSPATVVPSEQRRSWT